MCGHTILRLLPSRELEDSAMGPGEGGVPLWGVVPASGVQRDQPIETPSRAMVQFYHKRRTAEQWIKEGKQVVKVTRVSSHQFRSNQGGRH